MQEANAAVSLPPEPTDASEMPIRAPQTPECVSTCTPPVHGASSLHTTFSLQERGSASTPGSHATQSVSPGKLVAPHQASTGEATHGNVPKGAPLQHRDSALPAKELHEATRPAHQRAKQPPVRSTASQTLQVVSHAVRVFCTTWFCDQGQDSVLCSTQIASNAAVFSIQKIVYLCRNCFISDLKTGISGFVDASVLYMQCQASSPTDLSEYSERHGTVDSYIVFGQLHAGATAASVVERSLAGSGS